MKWPLLGWNRLVPFEGPLKIRYVSALICLLLFVAAVDTIPDPDVVLSASAHARTVCTEHVRANPTQRKIELTLLRHSLQLHQMNWSFWMLAFDAHNTSRLNLPQLHFAADTSPPVVF